MVTVIAWVLLLALASTSGVLAALSTYDFRGKVAGSTVENRHVAYTLAAATLAKAAEFSQAHYDGVEVDDAGYASQVAINAWREVGSGSASGGGISDNSGGAEEPSHMAMAPSFLAPPNLEPMRIERGKQGPVASAP